MLSQNSAMHTQSPKMPATSREAEEQLDDVMAKLSVTKESIASQAECEQGADDVLESMANAYRQLAFVCLWLAEQADKGRNRNGRRKMTKNDVRVLARLDLGLGQILMGSEDEPVIIETERDIEYLVPRVLESLDHVRTQIRGHKPIIADGKAFRPLEHPISEKSLAELRRLIDTVTEGNVYLSPLAESYRRIAFGRT